MKLFYPLILAAVVMCSGQAFSQCRTFVKNNCGEAMTGYITSENFNAARLMAGDEAELNMTFTGGEEYRLLMCHQPILEHIEFQILDTDKNVLFDNREHELVDHFDFRVPGTQELIVQVKVAEGKNKALASQGCVAILVGKKVTQ